MLACCAQAGDDDDDKFELDIYYPSLKRIFQRVLSPDKHQMGTNRSRSRAANSYDVRNYPDDHEPTSSSTVLPNSRSSFWSVDKLIGLCEPVLHLISCGGGTPLGD